MGAAGWPVKARSYQPILAITFSSFTSFALIALYHRSALRLDEHSWSSSLFAWFLLGIAYTHFFEWGHWLTHVEGNVIDRLIGRIPVLRTARSYHIRHHQSHHEIPTANFNFNPPFLGDWLGGTLRVPPRRPAPDGQAIRLETDLSR